MEDGKSNMRSITSFVCQECGYESPQWLGKCPECGAWNTLREFHEKLNITRSTSSGQISKIGTAESVIKPKTLDEIHYEEKERITTGFSEMDSVLGGGIVGGSVVLLAGDPGIGKSTLLLQVVLNIAAQHGTTRNRTRNHTEVSSTSSVLYVSGEESEEQIKLRAKRIIGSQKGIENLLLLSASNTDEIISIIENKKPALVIIDSIQTMESAALSGLSGSVGQVRYAASSFIKTAKSLKIPIILVGHVTKEGMVAGPMVLSHMVDTLLFLEGEKFTNTRLLRSLKNRFGPVDEVGVFSMESDGVSEVKNPEEIFFTKKEKDVAGSVLAIIMEGTRPFLIEVQSLVVFSKMPMPRRVASGIDFRRLELLIAVLQKHCRLPLESTDVFVNVAGGLKVLDPAVDLAVCLSVFSSFKNIPMGKTVAAAEVGLLGELRKVAYLEKRIKQAKKLGFRSIISAETHRYLWEAIGELNG